jgi:hypothetical protein
VEEDWGALRLFCFTAAPNRCGFGCDTKSGLWTFELALEGSGLLLSKGEFAYESSCWFPKMLFACSFCH